MFLSSLEVKNEMQMFRTTGPRFFAILPTNPQGRHMRRLQLNSIFHHLMFLWGFYASEVR
jgi:hypothetical protein